jgi:hypothetical protein
MKRLFTIFVTTLINISFSLVYAQPVQNSSQPANQKLREINYRPKLVADISNYLGDYKLINISLGADQEICLLAVNSVPEPEKGSIATFPPSKTSSHHNYKVVIIAKNSTEQIEITNESWNYHFVQPIDNNNNILLAGGRSHYYKDNSYDKNGRVFNKQGVLLRDFLLGDGIQDVQVSSQNSIWTSYFDEGVFGNYGWKNPIGSVGLRAWDDNGYEIYKYDNSGKHFISDCYALNVLDDNNVWFYFYTDFDLANKQRESVQYYKPNISGADGFIVYDKYVLFRGGYRNHNNYFLYERNPLGMKLLGEVKMFDGDGNFIETNYFAYRGSRMILLSGMKLYSVDLRQLVKTDISVEVRNLAKNQI